jgi:hypothetical protein
MPQEEEWRDPSDGGVLSKCRHRQLYHSLVF